MPSSGFLARLSLTRFGKSHYIALILAATFTAGFYWLNSQQYLAFQTRAPDADRFSQAIWNTLHGRFLFSTIKNESLLAAHFSPYMAVLSPLLLIWQDARILYLFQLSGIAVGGLLHYKMVYDRRPALALWLLLAFFLNPVLHQVALFELRRVTLAVPFLALAVYGLHKNRRLFVLLGLIAALLIKEDMGLIVSGIGLYLIFFRRRWKLGLGLSLFGLLWLIGMVAIIIPALGDGSYPQTGYFSAWGSSVDEILATMLGHPVDVLRAMIDRDSLVALWRISLPVAIFLPLLGFNYLIVTLPLLMVMLLSSEPEMHSLQRWYMAPVLPILFAAAGLGLSRLSRQRARWLTGALMGTTVLTMALYSPTPLGRQYEPHRFEVGRRQTIAREIVESVPAEARVVAQSAFTNQLAQREQIYLYPWSEIAEEEVDYLIMAEGFNAYPFPIPDMHWEILNAVADPGLVVAMEAEGIYLFRRGGEPLPFRPIGKIAEGAIKLDKVELAAADADGFFRPKVEQPVPVEPGQEIRVTFYWEALAAPNGERTVSVRVVDRNGALLAQKDSQPSEASRPTSWWEPGWYFRDVYYLALPMGAQPGPASLDLVLYDSFDLERVLFDNGEDVLHLFDFKIVEPGAGG